MGVVLIKMGVPRKNFACDFIIEPSFMKSCIRHCGAYCSDYPLHIVKGMTYTEVTEVLFISEKSVYRYLSHFHATGSVEPKEPSGDWNKGLPEFESFTMLQSILHKSTEYMPWGSPAGSALAHGYMFQPSVTQSNNMNSPERRCSLLLSSRVKQMDPVRVWDLCCIMIQIC